SGRCCRPRKVERSAGIMHGPFRAQIDNPKGDCYRAHLARVALDTTSLRIRNPVVLESQMRLVACGDALYSSRNLVRRLDSRITTELLQADAAFANAAFCTPRRGTPP